MYKVTKEQKLVLKFVCFASKIIYIKKDKFILFFSKDYLIYL